MGKERLSGLPQNSNWPVEQTLQPAFFFSHLSLHPNLSPVRRDVTWQNIQDDFITLITEEARLARKQSELIYLADFSGSLRNKCCNVPVSQFQIQWRSKCLAVSLSFHQISQVRIQCYGNSKGGHLTLTDGLEKASQSRGHRLGKSWLGWSGESESCRLRE